MKLIRLLTPLLISGCLVAPSHATESQIPVSWIQTNDGSAGVSYSSNYNDVTKILRAEISHSKSGNQRLYFSDLYLKDLNTCKYKTSIPDSTTVIFNGQAVKMLRWCKKFSDSNKYYYDLAPETDRGESYVINLFKAATSPIEIQYNNDTLYFPVIGFTKAWNSAGGNAI